MARDLTVRIPVDYMRLVTYREVLRAIVREASEEPWRDDEAADLARRVLEHFDDMEER